jgi:cyclin H
MDFDRSTQAKSWLFDEDSLAACRERAAAIDGDNAGRERRVRNSVKCARRFASGFHRSVFSECQKAPRTDPYFLEPEVQESMIQFHAHQIQTLVGPTALLKELRTSVTVLSTAIAFFRRFYLSNSVLLINPRKMAAACAFFAAKVEEEKIEVRSPPSSSLSHVPPEGETYFRSRVCQKSRIFVCWFS